MRMRRMAAVGLLALISATALAGLQQPAPVVVTLNPDGSGSAFGNMATARFSDNDVEYIGCGVRRVAGAAGPILFAFCQANTADEVVGFCETEDTVLVDSIDGLSDYSFITFAWNADGTCRSVGFSTQSFYIPDHSKKKK
jgi:hypothetical protein